MRLLLIGPRASGKSTIGRHVAERRGCSFVDLDDRVRSLFDGMAVTEIWRHHGERAWRDAEVDALRALIEPREDDHGRGVEPIVIALGGGTPTIDAARRLIEAEQDAGRVRVVYLSCPASTLRERLERAPGDRPSLTGRDPAAEVERVLAERDPKYRALADVVCDTRSGLDAAIADVEDAWLRGKDVDAPPEEGLRYRSGDDPTGASG